MTHEEINEWATAYINAQNDPDILKVDNHPLWWSIDRFMTMGQDVSAEDCWSAILEILSRAPDAKVLGVLAAGPLEDLIRGHGAQFIDRIEIESRRNKAFRHLLGGVWKGGEPGIWARVQKAQGEIW